MLGWENKSDRLSALDYFMNARELVETFSLSKLGVLIALCSRKDRLTLACIRLGSCPCEVSHDKLEL